MSFVVSFQGQFKPYRLPDLAGNERVRSAKRSSMAKTLKDHEDDDFEQVLQAEESAKRFSANKKLSAYKKAQGPEIPLKKTYFARDIMSSPVVFLSHCDTIKKASKEMTGRHFRHLPVLNEEEVLCGMLSEKDILAFGNKDSQEPVERAMTKEVLTAYEHTSLSDLARIMLHEGINSLPIINDRHQVTGIVTNSDILNLVVRAGHLEIKV